MRSIPRVSFYIITLLIAINICGYYPAIDNQFVHWDDQFYVTLNPLLYNATWDSFKELWTTVISLNYHPITMISLWLNAKYSGIQSAGSFISTNIVIHILNSLLVFFLSYRISNRKIILALVTALLFAIHPMHVESVVWVSERKDVLYSFFFLLSMIFYWDYTQRSKVHDYVLCLCMFLLSCLSKAMAVSLVPCLFLLDYIASRAFNKRKLYIEKIPFIAFALLIGIIAIDVQGGGDLGGMLSPTENANALSHTYTDVFERFKNSSFANFFYLSRFFIPIDLSPFHPYSLIQESNIWIYITISCGSITAFIWSIIQNKKVLTFSLGFYFFTIALVLQFFPVGSAIVAERYSYLPYIGLAYIIGFVFQKMWNAFNKSIVAFLLLLITVMLLKTTRAQSDIWQDHNTLFSQAVTRYPDDPFSRKTLASGLWSEGKLDSAIYHIGFAIEHLDLYSSSAIELLANSHFDLGNNTEALHYFDEAIRIDTTSVTARYHRAIALLEADPIKAIADFDWCEQSNNAYIQPLIYAPRGRAYGLRGQYRNAIKDLSKAIELYPEDIHNYLDRGISYEHNKEFKKAIEDYTHALKIDSKCKLAMDRLKHIAPTEME